MAEALLGAAPSPGARRASVLGASVLEAVAAPSSLASRASSASSSWGQRVRIVVRIDGGGGRRAPGKIERLSRVGAGGARFFERALGGVARVRCFERADAARERIERIRFGEAAGAFLERGQSLIERRDDARLRLNVVLEVGEASLRPIERGGARIGEPSCGERDCRADQRAEPAGDRRHGNNACGKSANRRHVVRRLGRRRLGHIFADFRFVADLGGFAFDHAGIGLGRTHWGDRRRLADFRLGREGWLFGHWLSVFGRSVLALSISLQPIL